MDYDRFYFLMTAEAKKLGRERKNAEDGVGTGGGGSGCDGMPSSHK